MDTKKWYLSKTVWTGIVTVLIGLYELIDVNIHNLPDIPGWVLTILGAIGIYSRVSATTKIN